jgi:hypothetical protein
MNDVRDSRRKHLDELDKETEMKEEMIERLKQNWTGFEGLPQEEGAFLLRHHRDCLRWGGTCGWVKVHSESRFDGGNIYRLRPDFQLPEPVKPRFVEYDIIQDGLFYACSVSHLRNKDESVLFNLSDLPSIVGFAGVKFLLCDGTESSWTACLTCHYRANAPATPIKARFYITKGEK